MKMPKQVTKAAEDADKLRKEVYAELEDETKEKSEPETAAAPEPTAQPTKKPEEEGELLRKAEARYNSLRGKYDAEVPRMQKQIQDLTTSLREALAKPADIDNNNPNDANPETDTRLVTNAEVEEYGEEFLDVVKRTAKEEMARTMSHLSNENQHLRNRVQSLDDESQSNREGKFYAYVDKTVDNWREINQDEGFIEWLDATDEFSGSTRSDLISNAYSQLNAKRVASFFFSYAKEQGAQGTPVAKPKLEDFAAPATKPPSPEGNEADVVLYSEEEIKKFYDDSRRGLYDSRREEYAKKEADINHAIREGRVMPNAELQRRMSM